MRAWMRAIYHCLLLYIYKQPCKIKNQHEDHWFASFRSFIDLPQAIYGKLPEEDLQKIESSQTSDLRVGF